MLIVLSPAKSLDFESPVIDVDATRAEFSADAAMLIRRLRELSPAQVAALMDLSGKLARLNVDRYASFALRRTPPVARQAVLAFDGDVYDGLGARSLPADALRHAQSRLRILSGLYGVLRPLDLIQPHRLEMGTRLETPRGGDLYRYWGERPAKSLRRALAGLEHPVLVNLASEEYFRAVDPAVLGKRVIQPVFQERRDGAFRVISFAAKRARGAMARFAIERRLADPEDLKAFDAGGYRYDPRESDDTTWYFRRDA